MRGCEREKDRGFVTAESAVVLPVLVIVAMALVGALLAVVAQIECVDAARAGARAAARQDPADAVVEVAREAAPRGAKVTLSREGDQVRVAVVAKPMRRWTGCLSKYGRRPWRWRRTVWGWGVEDPGHGGRCRSAPGLRRPSVF